MRNKPNLPHYWLENAGAMEKQTQCARGVVEALATLSGLPESNRDWYSSWIPAFAGMTESWPMGWDSTGESWGAICTNKANLAVARVATEIRSTNIEMQNKPEIRMAKTFKQSQLARQAGPGTSG